MAPALLQRASSGVYTLLQESAGKRLELKRIMTPQDLFAPSDRAVHPPLQAQERSAFGGLGLTFSVVVLGSRFLQHDNAHAPSEVVAKKSASRPSDSIVIGLYEMILICGMCVAMVPCLLLPRAVVPPLPSGEIVVQIGRMRSVWPKSQVQFCTGVKSASNCRGVHVARGLCNLRSSCASHAEEKVSIK